MGVAQSAATSAQAQMQQEHQPGDAFPWWCRMLAKGLGIIGGFLSLLFGALGLLSFSATCIAAVLLQIMGIIPIFMCAELNTILGAGTIFASGVTYAVMALGKKADRNTMMGAAGDAAWNAPVNQPTPPPAGFNPA